MENKYILNPVKRNDNKLKDRGDSLLKFSQVNKLKPIGTKKEFLPDRGDTGTKLNKSENLSEKNTHNMTKNKVFNNSESVAASKKNVDSERLINRTLSIEEKKRLRDKYTFRYKTNDISRNNALKSNVMDSLTKVNNDKKRNSDSEEKEKSDDSPKSEMTKTDKQSEVKEKTSKRPVIRTITAKNDATKVYKAVTFAEQKQKPTQLKIKIPNDVLTKTTKIPKLIQYHEKPSKTVIKEKPHKTRIERRKIRSKFRDDNSPVKRNYSPPTEVAKWAPNSINKHTKPYYEAWVDTTLTAISKMSRKEKLLFEAQHLDTLKKILQRPESPELMYENFLDERFTGRIKINHRIHR